MIEMKNYPADDSRVRALGRTLFLNGIRYLGWSCSAVEFVFTGTEASAEIWTDWALNEPWQEIFQGYLAVFVNGGTEPSRRFAVNAGTNSYTLYKSERAETVKIKLMKLSEAGFDKIGIRGISADGDISPAPPLPRRMEFIGDSITCGFGIEGKNGEERFRTETENPYITYAALTARSFGADFNLISWSSIGVYSSHCGDGNADTPNDGWVMPKLYGYTDIGTENTLGTEDHAEWDFGRFPPDVIVINLGTNDESFTRDIPERAESFKAAYTDFLKNIREKNPEAHIICALGMMCGKLYPAVEAAVGTMNDSRIHALEFDIQKREDGFGAEMHPNRITHRKAAAKLSEKVAEITGWEYYSKFLKI